MRHLEPLIPREAAPHRIALRGGFASTRFLRKFHLGAGRGGGDDECLPLAAHGISTFAERRRVIQDTVMSL